MSDMESGGLRVSACLWVYECVLGIHDNEAGGTAKKHVYCRLERGRE